MANVTINALKKAIQEIVAPDLAIIKDELKDVKSDIKELRVEIKRLDEKIDSKHNEAVGLFQRLDEKIDSGLARLDEKIDSKHNEEMGLFQRLDEKIDSLRNEIALERNFGERISALEVKFASLMNSR